MHPKYFKGYQIYDERFTSLNFYFNSISIFVAMVVDRSNSNALFKSFVQANTFTAIRESFELLCHSLEIDTKDYGTVYEKLKTGVRIEEAVSLWKLLDNRAQQRVYENGNVSAQQKVKIRCYSGHLGYSIIRCDAHNSFLR